MPRIPILVITLLWVNSLIAQVLLARSGHPVSLAPFAFWALVDSAISFGLWRRVRLAFWCALILAVLHLVPAALWAAGTLPVTLTQRLPSWYPTSLWIDFVLGLTLSFFVVYYCRPSSAIYRRFSFGWCITLAFAHLAVTYVIAEIYLSAGRGTSISEAPRAFIFWKSILWLWTPLAMAARSPNHTPNEELLIALTLLWSCFFGVVVGFVIPSIRRWFPGESPHDKASNP